MKAMMHKAFAIRSSVLLITTTGTEELKPKQEERVPLEPHVAW